MAAARTCGPTSIVGPGLQPRGPDGTRFRAHIFIRRHSHEFAQGHTPPPVFRALQIPLVERWLKGAGIMYAESMFVVFCTQCRTPLPQLTLSINKTQVITVTAAQRRSTWHLLLMPSNMQVLSTGMYCFVMILIIS